MGRSIYDFPWSTDAPIWKFGFSLAGALLIILTKWSFGLLSEKSKTFFRINRSEIVNLDFIENLKPDFHDRLEISLQNLKTKFVSSISRTPDLRKWLENQ